MTRRPKSKIAVALVALLSACGSDDVEERLVGTWQSVLMGPQGTWTLTFEPDAHGHYRTRYAGAFAPAEEKGTIEARDGKWRLEKDAGGEDEGTYAFVTPDAVVFTGKGGVLTWTRVGGSSLTGAAAVPGAMPAGLAQGQGARLGIAPEKIEWPARGVPELARKATEQARKWKSDAVLLSIEAELHQGTQAQYIPTELGAVSLEFRYFSPSASMGLQVNPGAPGNETYEMGFVDWGSEKPIPDDFMDLADAVARAKGRGMRAPTAQRAELRDWAGSSVGGVGAKGFAWMIYPPTQFRERPLLIPIADAEQAKVRDIDPCALVTADEAAAVLGDEVSGSAQSQRPNVWDCRYSAKSNRQRTISINVDEDPHRDAGGFLRNLARNGRPKVEGLGDDAYIFDSPAGFVELNVVTGKTLLSMGMNDPSSSTRADEIKKMGERAIERLRSGTAVALKAGPLEAVVGTWQAELEDNRFELVVAKDFSLKLSAHAADGSSADGKGFVDLTSDGRATFHFPESVGNATGVHLEHDATVEHGGSSDRFVTRLYDGARIEWRRPGVPASAASGANGTSGSTANVGGGYLHSPRPPHASGAVPNASSSTSAGSAGPNAAPPHATPGTGSATAGGETAPRAGAPAPSGEQGSLEQKTVEAGRKAADWSADTASKVGGFFKGLVDKDDKKKGD